MWAQMTAFELFLLVLSVGLVGGITGWVGGMGARLSYAARVDRLEGTLLQVLNRAKGQAGQAQTQITRNMRGTVMQEAEVLRLKLLQGRAQQVPNFRSPEEEQAHWMAVAKSRGLGKEAK